MQLRFQYCKHFLWNIDLHKAWPWKHLLLCSSCYSDEFCWFIMNFSDWGGQDWALNYKVIQTVLKNMKDVYQNTCCDSQGILKLFLQYIVFLQLMLLLKYLKDRIIIGLGRMTLFFDITTNKTVSVLSCGLSQERGSPANLERQLQLNWILKAQFQLFAIFCL